MLDIQFIRDNLELVRTAINNKQATVDVDKLLVLDDKRRELLAQTETLAQRRNTLAAEQKNGKPSEVAIEQGKELKRQFEEQNTQLEAIEQDYTKLLYQVPNIPSQDTPVGASEDDNIVLSTWGSKPEFDFVPKSHVELGEAAGWIDLKRAAKVSGSRFVYLKGSLVRLQMAIMQFTIDQLTDKSVIGQIVAANKLDLPSKPFELVIPPMMMRTDSYEATARLKAEEVTYKLADDDLWLIGSAEHSIVAMHQDEILPEAELPIRYLGYSTSFRREAASYGKDLNGILRTHHFDKLELETIGQSDQSADEHKLFIALQEYLMQQLNLHYQVVLKCTADMGSPNARGVDIEAWLPSQDLYRETHSADYMTDYQARRLKTRIRSTDGNTSFAHTNDATAFAIGRTMIAIIEQNQQADGTVHVPEALQKYFGADTL